MEQLLIITVAIIVGIAIGGFVFNKISKRGTESTFDIITQLVDLVLELSKETSAILAKDKDDFNSKDEFIDYIASMINNKLLVKLEEAGIYNKLLVLFSEDSILNLIKYIITLNEDKLDLPEFEALELTEEVTEEAFDAEENTTTENTKIDLNNFYE